MLAAYRCGLFPMGIDADPAILPPGSDPHLLGWWSPHPRGILRPGRFHASKSMLKSAKHFDITTDQAFAAVVAGCAEPDRPHGWIDQQFAQAYDRLFELGWAHSVEVWCPADARRELCGGLFGIEIGGLFAAESMFHRRRDASKVALGGLCSALAEASGERLIDVQWSTPHLASLGAEDISRPDYLRRLTQVLRLPPALT